MAHLPATVLERIFEKAWERPEAIALRRCDGTGVLRYTDLVAEIDKLADDLESRNVSPESRVFVLSDNGPETYLAVLACAKIRAIAVIVDGNLPPAAVNRFAELTGPEAMLIAPQIRLQTSDLCETLQSIPTRTVQIPADTTDSPRDLISEQLIAPADAGADDPLAMIFTSGTTGTPKAVVLPNRSFFAIADILRQEQLTWVDWVDGETTYSPLPASHIGGLWWILNCLMHGGLCVTGGENTSSILSTLAVNGVATTCLVPTLLTRLVSELRSTGGSVPSSLRLIGYGGSRAIASDVAFVESAGVRTAQVYGLSETGCTALCLPSGGLSIARIEAGAVGRPYPGVQVRLANEDGGEPGRIGADSASFGTLWIKSPANMLGYWNDPDRTAEVLVDGWVNTGDLLELRHDGFFYIKGRSSELIISGGVNIAPDEVDRIAEDVAGVREAACFEIPDEEFGALVGLAVVASTPLSEPGSRKLKQDIAARFRREFETMARPAAIVVVQDIPRTPSGKVVRSALAATGAFEFGVEVGAGD